MKKSWTILTILMGYSLLSAQTVVNVRANQAEKLQLKAQTLVIENGNTISLGDSVKIIGGTQNYTFEWFRDGSLIGNSMWLQVPYTNQNSLYEIRVKDAQNCTATLNSQQTYLNNLPPITAAIVYPNPARERIYIDIQDSYGIYQISILNYHGSLVHQSSAQGKTILNIGFTPGLYFILIENDTISFSKCIAIL